MATASYAIFGQSHDFRVYNYTTVANQTASTVIAVKSLPGVLHGFMVSSIGAAATSTLTLIDGTASGNATIFAISGTTPINTVVTGLDINFTTGLGVQASVTTSSTPSITLIWK